MPSSEVFLRACRGEPVEYTPVWLMRQAGRYLAEYRAVRQKVSFLAMCKTPELATEVTLQPVEKLGVDAAIIFSDILLPLEGMGIRLEYSAKEGPVIHNPLATEKDIQALRLIDPEEDVPFLLEAIRTVNKTLSGRIPLIGFAGAPFTLASYMIEGGHSRDFVKTKTLMYGNPGLWQALMEKLSTVITRYLHAQVKAGAQALQLFDSWVGCLSPGDYAAFVLPYSRAVFRALGAEVPTIHFGTGSSTLLALMKQAGGTVIGVDWRIELSTAWERIGPDRGIQGNLDPVSLFGPISFIRSRVQEILASAGNRPGHIFNLGHGILPQTPVDHAKALVDAVHELSQR